MYRKIQHIEHEVCNCVRWKSMFYQAEPDPSVPRSNEDGFWCALTQRVLGPDGQVVSPQECKPGRACFKEAL
ncbi:MAG: hypothetical protein AB1898_21025 [Acidobacteriota bacterium]